MNTFEKRSSKVPDLKDILGSSGLLGTSHRVELKPIEEPPKTAPLPDTGTKKRNTKRQQQVESEPTTPTQIQMQNAHPKTPPLENSPKKESLISNITKNSINVEQPDPQKTGSPDFTIEQTQLPDPPATAEPKSVRFTDPPRSEKGPRRLKNNSDGVPSKPSTANSTFRSNNGAQIPPTRIPEKYHKIERSPILPSVQGATDDFEFKDSKWNKVWFPSKKPFDRREVHQLTLTFEQMLQELEEGGLDPVASIEQEQRIYDVVLHEVIRQVYVECADRGILLEKVSKRYRTLFEKVPSLLQQMQIEIDELLDANKSLRTLLEKLMEEKSQQGWRMLYSSDPLEQQAENSKSDVKKLEGEIAKLRIGTSQLQDEIIELKRERDNSVMNTVGVHDKITYVENINKSLELKNTEAQANIKNLTAQLETALSKLNDFEQLQKKQKKEQEAIPEV